MIRSGEHANESVFKTSLEYMAGAGPDGGAHARPAQAKTKYKMPCYITVDVTNQIVAVCNTADGSIAL